MNRRYLIVIFIIFAVAGACSRSRKTVIKGFPLNNLDNIVAAGKVALDKDISSDGAGSLRIDAPESLTVPLYNVTALDVNNARLIYSAKVRTHKVIGQVFLGMICFLPGRSPMESQGQLTLQSGTDDWREQEASLDLPKGPIPDSVKLNLIINGHGIVWIDDIRLSRMPIPQ